MRLRETLTKLFDKNKYFKWNVTLFFIIFLSVYYYMSIGYCTRNSLFCLFVMIRLFDFHLNRHFIVTTFTV
jgi:hypothetical protein